MLSRRGPQHVLITTSTFPMTPDDKVSARFILDLAQHLTAHCRVTVLAPAGPQTSAWEQWGDVRVRRFPYFVPATQQRLAAGEGMVATMRASWFAKLQAPFFVASQWAMLPELVRDEGIDALNPHWIIPQGFTAAFWRDELRLPNVVSAHGADVAWLDRARFGPQVARYVFANADGFIADSAYLATRCEQIIGRSIPHAAIPMGVETSVFQPGERPASLAQADGVFTLLFVGKLVPKKGVDVLLSAVRQLRDRAVPLRLLIIGGGPLESEIRAQVAQLQLGDTVTLLGWVKNHELPSYYASADVVCVPSVQDAHGETEGTPVVLQEALSCGAIVVASQSSGIVDVMRDGVNGFAVASRDASALAIGIERALALSPDARAAMRLAARAQASEASWPRVAARYYDVFSDSQARLRG